VHISQLKKVDLGHGTWAWADARTGKQMVPIEQGFSTSNGGIIPASVGSSVTEIGKFCAGNGECRAVATHVPDWGEPKILDPPEHSRTYSSVHNNDAIGHGHARSMLDSLQAWSSAHSKAGQWMTIDAGFEAEIHGVVIQARLHYWQMVTKFKVLTSNDGHHFTYVESGREFTGNNQPNVKNTMRFTPVNARYVRIEVRAWNQHISARAALMVQMPKILDPPEASRTYSSVYGNDNIGHGHARSMLDSPQAWSSAHNKAGQWMQIDAGYNAEIMGVVLQSRLNSWQMVTKFKVYTKMDGHHWASVDGGRAFTGNQWHDQQLMVGFKNTIKARHVRIEVLGWRGHMSARAALMVVPPPILDPPEASRTYSSVHANNAIGTGHARSMIDSPQAWSSDHNKAGQWMTIDAGYKAVIAGVVIQSRKHSWQMITKFTVHASADCRHFHPVEGRRQFAGNQWHDQPLMVGFANPIEARCVRIEALEWKQWISARAALLLDNAVLKTTECMSPCFVRDDDWRVAFNREKAPFPFNPDAVPVAAARF
jgi:hypothetical protein